jgi:signal transduction histidine kinase
MAVVDGTYEVQTTNQEFVEAVDAESIDAVCGMDVLEFVPETERGLSKQRLDTVLENEVAVDPREFKLQTMSEELRHARGSIAPTSLPEIEAAAHIVLEDVTETRKQKWEIEQHRTRIEALHAVAVELSQCETYNEVFELTVEAAERILEFDMCIVDSVQDGRFRVEATSESVPDEGYHEPPLEEAGVAGLVYQDGDSLICNLQDHPEAAPQADYHDTITVPIPEYGVFQAGSYDTDVYDQTDLELAELLASHVREALQRIDHEQELEHRQREQEQQREKIERLHDVGVAMTECHDPSKIYELMIEAGEDILGLDQCVVDSVRDGVLRTEAMSEALSDDDIFELPVDSEEAGLAGKAYRSGESILDEHEQQPEANPESEFRSSITVPIAEYGVFQAVSADVVAFDRSDVELVELLAEHAQAALQRLDHEHELEQRGQALEQQREQIKKLHEIGVEIAGCESPDRIYDLLVEAGEDILGLDLCLSGAVEDGQLVVKATSSNLTEDGYGEPIIDSDEAGLAGKAYQTNRSILRDGEEHPDANPRDDYSSSITVPIEGFGLFQAVSYEVVGFDQFDLELVELLAGHARQALQRLDHEQKLDQQRERVTRLHDVRTALANCTSQERVGELVVETGKRILNLDICYFGVVEDGKLYPQAVTENMTEEGYFDSGTPIEEAGLSGEAYLDNESILSDNVYEDPRAKPQDEYGAMITVPVEGYGILQAGSYKTGAFDQADLEVVELLAEHAREALQRIAYETELEQQRQELDLLRQIFSRVFRHNVRNELTIIQGNAELIETKVTDEDIADRATLIMESSQKLTDHTDKAREVEEIVQKKQDQKTASLQTIVSTAIAEYRDAYPESQIHTDVDDIEVTVINGVESAIGNAVENALEHNDGPVTIEITSEVGPDTVTVRIEDDGAGIPQSDLEALNSEAESKLTHSSGVGLWLMKWIVEKSDGSITLSNTDEGACVEMVLTRA